LNAAPLTPVDRFVASLTVAVRQDLQVAEANSRMLVETLRRLHDDAGTRLGLPADQLPGDIG
jgi:hypothetical protein